LLGYEGTATQIRSSTQLNNVRCGGNSGTGATHNPGLNLGRCGGLFVLVDPLGGEFPRCSLASIASDSGLVSCARQSLGSVGASQSPVSPLLIGCHRFTQLGKLGQEQHSQNKILAAPKHIAVNCFGYDLAPAFIAGYSAKHRDIT